MNYMGNFTSELYLFSNFSYCHVSAFICITADLYGFYKMLSAK